MKNFLNDVAGKVSYLICPECHAQKMDPREDCYPESENCVKKELFGRIMKRLREVEAEIDAELGGAHDEL